jgi:uncharacterized protein with gpF-like domain
LSALAVSAKKKDKIASSSQAERFRLSLMRNQMRYEKQYRRLLAPVFKEQRHEALINLEAHASSLKGFVMKSDQKLFDDAKYDALITSKLQPSLQDLTQTQGGLAMTFAGSDGNEFHMSSNIISQLESSTRRMATNFNDETLAALNTTLAQGIQSGEGISDLKSRINEVYDDLDGYRAERIARTETLKASNHATEDAYKQTGYVVGKQWVVNPDACAICEEFEGVTVELDQPFINQGDSVDYGDNQNFAVDYEDIETPPLHPNCRCTIIPTTSLGDNPATIGQSSAEGQTVYRGEGANVSSDYGLLFGDALYVARNADQAANFGTVHQLKMPLKGKDILLIRTDKQLESFHLAAQKWAVEQGLDLDPNSYLPAYLIENGYKAAEVLESVDPLGGIGIVDKKIIAAMRAQIDAD